MKAVFNQMETEVAKCSVDKKYFEIEKKEISLDNVLHANNKCLVHDILEIKRLELENDHLFKLLLSQDIVHICVNSFATLTNYAKMEQDYIDEYSENLMLKAELAKKEDMVEKRIFDEVVLRCTDIAKISKKQSKPDKHGHGNGIECTRAGRLLSK
ncbi:hypothetical protein Tco_1431715, partial [Tanacetum coccineum]